MAKYWYAYNGTGDPFIASNYQILNPPSTPHCVTGTTICAIYATGSGDNLTPNAPFSSNIQQYIALALTDQNLPQPSGDQFYVYLRD